MEERLARAAMRLKEKPQLAGYEVRQVEGELHLSKGSECFARLIPTGKTNEWRIEHFHNQERWESVDFVGSLEECLDFLSDNPHFLFWEG